MGQSSSKNAVTTGLKHCTLWKTDRSPACRAVMMALDAMNLSITEVDVNMDKGEHRSPELAVGVDYIAQVFRHHLTCGTAVAIAANHGNPQHLESRVLNARFAQFNPLQTLPIFKDRELVICDSHAINTYLATRYCDTGRILPKDPGGRALTEQVMHYDSGVLYPRYRAAAYPIMYENCRFVMPQNVCEIECAYRDLECMLVGRTWVGGSWPTLADITLAATVSTLSVLVPIDKLRYPRLSGWLYRMSEEIYYITANKKGLGEFARRIGELSDVEKSYSS